MFPGIFQGIPQEAQNSLKASYFRKVRQSAVSLRFLALFPGMKAFQASPPFGTCNHYRANLSKPGDFLYICTVPSVLKNFIKTKFPVSKPDNVVLKLFRVHAGTVVLENSRDPVLIHKCPPRVCPFPIFTTIEGWTAAGSVRAPPNTAAGPVSIKTARVLMSAVALRSESAWAFMRVNACGISSGL